jgi:hypothetical protein
MQNGYIFYKIVAFGYVTTLQILTIFVIVMSFIKFIINFDILDNLFNTNIVVLYKNE